VNEIENEADYCKFEMLVHIRNFDGVFASCKWVERALLFEHQNAGGLPVINQLVLAGSHFELKLWFDRRIRWCNYVS
jgi:hypothetical protein